MPGVIDQASVAAGTPDNAIPAPLSLIQLVNVAAEDVLVAAPAIIDVNITVAETMSSGLSTPFTASTGAATLYLELFDSIASDILDHAAHRQAIRNGGGMVCCSNRITFTAEARRKFGAWPQGPESFSAPVEYKQLAVSLAPARVGRN